MSTAEGDITSGWGSGSNLPLGILATALLSAFLATTLSCFTIILQLKNYRSVHLQRWVVRILVMVPIYAISSTVSLFSSSIAFYLDALRDCYEAFVIYCFFSLLVEFLGGERSLIISLAGRPPTPHSFPFNRCLPPVDMSDPFTFLNVKRGVLQYTQIKPVLAFITMILKATGSYSEGTLKANNAYTYISVVYNISISVALYSLVIFWQTTHKDLKPFRPLPKFICIKGLLFMTFWQGFAISILVSAKAIRIPRYSSDDAALAISDALICCEMPIFALLHLYSFSHYDYVDDSLQYAGRLPLSYALRDSLFGYRDVFYDSLVTLRGQGFSYSTFESSESAVHSGQARANRIKAGLRYADGGKRKYWLPQPGITSNDQDQERSWKSLIRHPMDGLQQYFEEERVLQQGYAPITSAQANRSVRVDPNVDLPGPSVRPYDLAEDDDKSSLEFDEPEETEDLLYNDARQLEFGDWNNPVLDASREEARRRRRQEEDEAVSGRGGLRQKGQKVKQKGKEVVRHPANLIPMSQDERQSNRGGNDKLPDGCVDLVVEDPAAEEDMAETERTSGDVNQMGGKERKAWRQVYGSPKASTSQVDDDDNLVTTADSRASGRTSPLSEPQQSEDSLSLAREVEPPTPLRSPFADSPIEETNPWA